MLETSSEYNVIKYFIIIVSILCIIKFTSILYYLSSYSSKDIIRRIYNNKNKDDFKVIDEMISVLLKRENIDKNDIKQIKKKIHKYKIILYLLSILSIIISLLFLVYILNFKNLSTKSRSILKKILIAFITLSIIINTGFLLIKGLHEFINIILCLFVLAFLNSK